MSNYEHPHFYWYAKGACLIALTVLVWRIGTKASNVAIEGYGVRIELAEMRQAIEEARPLVAKLDAAEKTLGDIKTLAAYACQIPTNNTPNIWTDTVVGDKVDSKK